MFLHSALDTTSGSFVPPPEPELYGGILSVDYGTPPGPAVQADTSRALLWAAAAALLVMGWALTRKG